MRLLANRNAIIYEYDQNETPDSSFPGVLFIAASGKKVLLRKFRRKVGIEQLRGLIKELLTDKDYLLFPQMFLTTEGKTIPAVNFCKGEDGSSPCRNMGSFLTGKCLLSPYEFPKGDGNTQCMLFKAILKFLYPDVYSKERRGYLGLKASIENKVKTSEETEEEVISRVVEEAGIYD